MKLGEGCQGVVYEANYSKVTGVLKVIVQNANAYQKSKIGSAEKISIYAR
jgi:hypothetical protein